MRVNRTSRIRNRWLDGVVVVVVVMMISHEMESVRGKRYWVQRVDVQGWKGGVIVCSERKGKGGGEEGHATTNGEGVGI